MTRTRIHVPRELSVCKHRDLPISSCCERLAVLIHRQYSDSFPVWSGWWWWSGFVKSEPDPKPRYSAIYSGNRGLDFVQHMRGKKKERNVQIRGSLSKGLHNFLF